MNAIRAAYLAVFFVNAIFAALFKSIGEDVLQRFGTFSDCDQTKNESCTGNQLVLRASFSISLFFAVQTGLSRFLPLRGRNRAFFLLGAIELPIYVALLIGSVFIPCTFFDGYAHFSRVISGFFILFQIFSIVDFSYQLRDKMLDKIDVSIQDAQTNPCHLTGCKVLFWKASFLGFCLLALSAAGAGIGVMYDNYRDCSIGLAFISVTVVGVVVFLALCVSTWLDVGLLPPCVVGGYVVLLCWQALLSSTDTACDKNFTARSESSGAIAYNALVGAFSITWTSWRTSSAASNMIVVDRSPDTTSRMARPSNTTRSTTEFSPVAVSGISGDLESPPHKSVPPSTAGEGLPSPPAAGVATTANPEPWSFYLMMALAGVYMAMVLTDWDSGDIRSNGVSMWVKIVAQWSTMILFFWTLIAPKVFPDRDFSPR